MVTITLSDGRSFPFGRVYFFVGRAHRRAFVETKAQEITRRRFTVHDYHHMAEAGILHEDDRVELIEGDIVEMAAIGSRHFTCVNELNRLLARGMGDEAIVSVQNPVRLGEYWEPQPDLAVIRNRDYRESQARRGETPRSKALSALVVPVDAVLG